MGNVLLVTSSPRGDQSHSSRVALDLASSLGGDLTVRELWRDPLDPIGPDFVQAMFTPEENRTDDQRALLRPSDAVIEELLAADTVIIAAGMVNFSQPATLKTWIDHVVRAGVTFRYGESGPEGLVTGKKVYLVLATGGVYSDTPLSAMDHLEPALRTQLGFIGLTDVSTIRIEGTMRPSAEEALTKAGEQVRELAGVGNGR